MPFFNDFGGPTVYKIEQFFDKPFEWHHYDRFRCTYPLNVSMWHFGVCWARWMQTPRFDFWPHFSVEPRPIMTYSLVASRYATV
jgi:hypothetical protein